MPAAGFRGTALQACQRNATPAALGCVQGRGARARAAQSQGGAALQVGGWGGWVRSVEGALGCSGDRPHCCALLSSMAARIPQLPVPAHRSLSSPALPSHTHAHAGTSSWRRFGTCASPRPICRQATPRWPSAAPAQLSGMPGWAVALPALMPPPSTPGLATGWTCRRCSPCPPAPPVLVPFHTAD